jgi:hypothetical protein
MLYFRPQYALNHKFSRNATMSELQVSKLDERVGMFAVTEHRYDPTNSGADA